MSSTPTAGFLAFQADMKQRVIPEQLAEFISSEADAAALISSQWDDMPPAERASWEAKADPQLTAGQVSGS